MTRRVALLLLASIIGLALLLAACDGDDDGGGDGAGITLVTAGLDRDDDPAVATADLSPLVEGNTAFAFDLYGLLGQEEGNLFFSPYSISVALAMTYAGAAGETAGEMRQTLHFDLPADQLHASFNRLDLDLALRSEAEIEEDDEPFQLSIANSVWAEETYEFLDSFLETLALNYGAGARLVDFINEPDESRQTINAWVSEQTQERIPELIPQGIINEMTRLVLTNAIYFKASWAEPFAEELTQDGDFHLLSGDTVTAPMMRFLGTETLLYAEEPGLQAVELPYAGDEVAMLLLLPEEGAFASFEAELDAARLAEIVAALEPQPVSVVLPRFEFSADVPLKQTLIDLGMPAAFEPAAADFSGMDGSRSLFIQDVLHKAFVSVDENGTEAAAATAVVVGLTAAPAEPKLFEADRPFVFLIRDRVTGAILFAGRLVDPQG